MLGQWVPAPWQRPLLPDPAVYTNPPADSHCIYSKHGVINKGVLKELSLIRGYQQGVILIKGSQQSVIFNKRLSIELTLFW